MQKQINAMDLTGKLIDPTLDKSQETDTFYSHPGDASDVEVCQKLNIMMEAMAAIRRQVSKASWEIYCNVTIKQIPAREVAKRFGLKTSLVHLNNCQIQKMICQTWDFDGSTELSPIQNADLQT